MSPTLALYDPEQETTVAADESSHILVLFLPSSSQIELSNQWSMPHALSPPADTSMLLEGIARETAAPRSSQEVLLSVS